MNMFRDGRDIVLFKENKRKRHNRNKTTNFLKTYLLNFGCHKRNFIVTHLD